MDDISNAARGKFNFRVKIVQTDLNSRGYYFGGESPMIFQNSSYISKLYHINSYPGAILAKDRIEDMPERYRRFIQLDNPSASDIIKNLKKDIIMLANREDVGQNVFYSRLSNPEAIPEPVRKSAPAGNLREVEYTAATKAEIREKFESFAALENFGGFGDFEDEFFFDFEDGDMDGENFGGVNFDDSGENPENYEDYQDDEEIRDILHLNNYYNSDTYKMSKIEYDFTTSGNINRLDDGSLEVKYDESEVSGFKDSYIQFLFHPNNKNIVTVRRKYFFDVWFALEKGKRISIEKRGQFTGSVLTAHTKELVNKMTANGGEMRFVYVNEMDGVPLEMISHSIKATPVGAE